MRVVVLWEDGFPTLDCCEHPRELIEQACGKDVLFCSDDELPAALAQQPDVVINPYGSAFSKACWPQFSDYLKRGGSWLNLGGDPLSRPVRRENGRWEVECPQRAYAKELRINHAFETETQGLEWRWTEEALRKPDLPAAEIRRCWSLQVRFCEDKEFPDECGSTSVRLAQLRPLLEGCRDGRRIAAPIVCVDRFYGDFGGGRWLLVNADLANPLPAQTLSELIKEAAQGSVEFSVRPSFACYHSGESPAFAVSARAGRISRSASVRLQRISRGLESQPHRPGDVEPDSVEDPVAQQSMQIGGAHSFVRLSCPDEAASPGLHCYRAELLDKDTGELLAQCETGFWRYEAHLLRSNAPLTADRDYFWRRGKPFPVTGTTYMSGDTHRKFLFEPNPAQWDHDFARMKDAGVNVVRTGIWTAWSRIMLDPGAVDEGVLRAFAAFLLSACKYDIPVIFTFFAFLPPAWGGENPYLDPQSVAAQKAFVSAFVERFKECDIFLWDFINEPSFSSKANEWYTRPNYDRFEQEAWRRWLLEQASEDEWRERWRLTPNDGIALPPPEDFQDKQINQGAHPLRAMTYRLFAQEMFRRWAEDMASVVRATGNPAQLVTVGQDEGGTGERPAPHFYGPAVDFTSNHSWWQNDDLLWDSVFTKLPDKPNLIEETGIMFVESPDGAAWRTPSEARSLLERKMALSFAGGCAGFIQWLWNTNVYMDSDNEVGIGFLRADGTEKPELDAFRAIAEFFRSNAEKMTGRQREEAVIVIPHSNLFSARCLADRATRTAVRALEYGAGISTRCVSEYRMADLGQPRLIVLPVARNLRPDCWKALLGKVEQGSTLLATGFIDCDDYWRRVERLDRLGIKTHSVPVHRCEDLRYDAGAPVEPTHTRAVFSGEALQRVDRAVVCGSNDSSIFVVSHGKGKVIYCAVPLEVSSNADECVIPIYLRAAREAGISHCEDISDMETEVLRRREVFKDYTLLIEVNEASSKRQSRLMSEKREVPAGRIALAFVDNKSGEAVARLDVCAGSV
ncbi:MAG: cellulase family glycosylhydrolase [Armatimonadetes bacterium]|nr:cellulase family glycosylhydrolase [Armatimonadota bacterium]